MKSKRRKFSTAFKTKVALEAIKERRSVSELAESFELHPNQISKWKKQLLDNADQAFEETEKSRIQEEAQQQRDQLYQQIGRLQVENDWLKKKLP